MKPRIAKHVLIIYYLQTIERNYPVTAKELFDAQKRASKWYQSIYNERERNLQPEEENLIPLITNITESYQTFTSHLHQQRKQRTPTIVYIKTENKPGQYMLPYYTFSKIRNLIYPQK